MAAKLVALLDTHIIIDLLHGHKQAVEWLKSLGHSPNQLGVCAISHAEVIVGAKDTDGSLNRKKYDAALKLLLSFQRVDAVDMGWAYGEFGKYWLSHQLPFPDCLIASAAHLLDLPLFSRDRHLALLLPKHHSSPY